MTDKELHKLRRPELLELMFCMREELDRLKAENEELKRRLENSSESRVLLEKIYRTVCPEDAETEQTYEQE